MARGTRGPANSPEASVQQQLDQLSQRVRELETKRVLTAPVSSLDKTRDPVDGEHMLDYRDGSPMWYKGDDWRYGLPIATISILPQLINYESNPFDRDWQALELGGAFDFTSSEGFYLDEDFPTRMYVSTPGTYMTLLYAQMTNVEGWHGMANLVVVGEGRDPSDVFSLGSNNWFQTSNSRMSMGDPMLDVGLPSGANSALVYLGIHSFADHSESALDTQYAEDNPDDDEEVPFPSYTRWFEAKVWNHDVEAWTLNASVFTVLRLANKQI